MNLSKEIRDKERKKIKKLTSKKLADDIEESIYKYSEELAENNNTPFLLEGIYSTRSTEILTLIKDSNFILKAIKEKKIDPKRIAFLSPDELNPERYKEAKQKQEMEENTKKKQASTNAYTCPKCKARRSKVKQKQTRSADEPATTYVTCLECGYQFTV